MHYRNLDISVLYSKDMNMWQVQLMIQKSSKCDQYYEHTEHNPN